MLITLNIATKDGGFILMPPGVIVIAPYDFISIRTTYFARYNIIIDIKMRYNIIFSLHQKTKKD